MLKFTLSDNILKNMKAAKDAYDHFTEESWKAKVKTLKPGAPTPEHGVFYDEDNRIAFNKALLDFGADAKNTFKLFKNDLGLRTVAAPSADAERAIKVFSMTPAGDNMPSYRAQVDNMVNAYGSNPLAHEAIRSIAAQNGVHVEPHPAMRTQRSLADIEMNLNHFFDGNSVHSLEAKAPFDSGSVAFTAAMIDDFLNEIPEIV